MRTVRVRRKRFEPRPVSESGPKLFPHKQENIIPLKDAPAAEQAAISKTAVTKYHWINLVLQAGQRILIKPAGLPQ